MAAQLEKEAELAQAGIVDPYKAHRATPLKEHLDDFRKALLSQGATHGYAVQQQRRVDRVLRKCGFVTFQDISASKLQLAISNLKNEVRRKVNRKVELVETEQSASGTTKKYYLQACKQFLRWAVEDQRIGENPIAHLKPRKAKSGKRAALEPEEIRWLIAVTELSQKRCRIEGPERALLYRFAAETGFRASEIRALCVSDFDFDEKTVSLDGQHTKNRKDVIMPLRSETSVVLKKALQGKVPQAQAFRMPHPCTVVRMFRKDLAATRAMWLEEAKNDPKELRARQKSTFLDVEKDEGLVDFHSLRHSFGTMLAASGVHPKTAQQLMRHSDINLTMSRYTHTLRGAEAKAIESMPDLSRPYGQNQGPGQKATGTD